MDELPPPNRALPPPFHELSFDHFEELCRALLYQEPGIRTADLVGTRGQRQYGADITGESEDGGLHIVSCKCYEKAEKGHIPAACDEFLHHWDYQWKDKGVTRFILAISAHVNSNQRREEIDEQKEAFASKGVIFEVWSPRTLQDKMRPWPSIVRQYLGPAFVDRYCGRQQPQISDTPLDRTMLQQLSQMQEALAKELDSTLESVSGDLKRGRDGLVDRELNRLRSDPQRWAALSVESRARVIRLQASRELRSGTLEHATDLADEADALDDGKDGARLRASLAAESGDLEGALELLATSDAQEDVRLRASLWLALEKPERALEELSGLSGAEEFALQAHAFAVLGRGEEARWSLSEAEKMELSLLNVRRAGIAVRYWQAMSPEMPYRLDAGLQPVPLGLVRADVGTTEHLDRARDIARTTLEDPALASTWTEEFETWQLACLANQRDKTEEAEAYARALLKHPRPHCGALVWSMARGYTIDHRREIRRLEDMLGGGPAEVIHLTVMLALALDQGKPQRAERALSDHAARFPGHEQLIDQWRAIVAAELRNEHSGSLPPVLAVQRAAEDGDWDEVVRQIADRFTESDLASAYTGCEALAANGQWAQIEQFIPALLDRIQTPDAITMACFAAYHMGQPERARDISDRYRSHFADAKLPLSIRRIRLQGLQQSGKLPEAYEEADGLVSEGNLADIITAVNTRLIAGDIGGAVPLIRKVAEEESLPPQTALEYARVVRHVDPDVARDLWQRVPKGEIQGQLAELAVATAFELGLDDQAGPVIKALARNAEDPDSTTKTMTIEDLPGFLEQQRRHTEHVEREYRHGRIPLHIASDKLQVPMADWFSEAFLGNQPFPLYLVHGNRALASLGISTSTCRLRIDLTGLLTALHLDLLDVIERRWHPIELPFSLPQTLNGMERQLRPIQPVEVRANELLISLVEEQRIGEVDVESIRAGNETEYAECQVTIVDYTDNLAGPAAANPRRILEVLADVRAESPDLLETAASNMGVIGSEEPLGRHPKPGQEVSFSGNTIVLFAREGLLRALTTTFAVNVDSRYLQMARAEVAEHRRKTGVADHLHMLSDRIAKGIRSGAYQVLGYLDTESTDDDGEDRQGPIGATARCLVEAISSPRHQRTVLWVDDRNINGFRGAEALEIACVCDILAYLRDEKEISEGDYFAHLLHLREAGVRNIPVSSEEVLYYLRAAPCHGNRIQETRGLQALRRCLAETALSERELELDPSQTAGGERTDEFPLLQMLWRVPRETLVRLWNDDSAHHGSDTTVAYANWVYETLIIDHFSRLPLGDEPQIRRRLAVTGLAGFIVDGLQITQHSQNDGLRAAYFDWLDETILAPHSRIERAIITDVAEMVGDILDGLLRDAESSGSTGEPLRQDQVAVILADYVRALPERVRDALGDRSDLMQRLPLRIGPTVEIGDETFDAIAFFDGVAVAMRDGQAHIRSAEDQILCLEWNPEKPERISGNGRSCWNLDDPGLEVLADDVERRRRALHDHPSWIDRAAVDRISAIETIAGLEEPHARMLRLDDERRASAEFQYRCIEHSVAGRESIGPDQLSVISANMVLRHLRVDPDAEGDRVDDAAAQLLDELAPEDAIRRMVGLPIDLPRPMAEALWQLAPSVRHSLIHELGARSASPVRQMRAVEWAQSFPDCEVSVEPLIGHLFEDLEPRTRLLHENALWVERSFEADGSWRDLPQDVRLLTVWCHAERLTNLLLQAGVSPDSTASIAAQWTPRAFGPWFSRDPLDEHAPCSPHAVPDKSLAWTLVGTAVGDAANGLLSAEHRTALTETISHVTETGSRWPDPAVMATPSRSSCLDCIIGRDHPALRESLNDAALAERLSPAFREGLVGEALSELETTPSDSHAWTKILICRHGDLKTGEVERIVPMLERLDIKQLSADNTDTALAVIVYLCRSPTLMGYESARARAETFLLNLSSEHSGQTADSHSSRTTSPADDILITLSDALLHIVRNSRSANYSQQLVTLVGRIVETSADAKRLWQYSLPTIARQLPINAAKELWPLILRLRADCDSYRANSI